ncbi:MAG: VanZ family protein [Candidatus Binatia bacterium]
MKEGVWKWSNLLPLLLWIGMIVWVASRPKAYFFPEPRIMYGLPRQLLQYPYHVGVFFVLAVLFLRCFSPYGDSQDDRRSEALTVLGSMLVSGCSELIQFYVPTRTPAVRDLVLDLLGVLLGIFFMRRLLRPTGETLAGRVIEDVE